MRYLLKDQFALALRLGCILIALLVSGCNQPPDKEALNNRIDQIISGLNNKDSSEVMATLAQEFQGTSNLSRDNARRMMALYFLRHKSIDIVLTRRETTVNGDRASTDGTAVVAGRSQLLPETGRLIRFTGHWRKTDNEWQLYRLEWQ